MGQTPMALRQWESEAWNHIVCQLHFFQQDPGSDTLIWVPSCGQYSVSKVYKFLSGNEGNTSHE